MSNILTSSGYCHALSEVGKELGISRERVGQIEQTALAKVRAALEAKGLTPPRWILLAPRSAASMMSAVGLFVLD
jgi:hypothetical protein